MMGWTTPLHISSTSIAGRMESLLSASISGTDHVGDYKYPLTIRKFDVKNGDLGGVLLYV